MAVIKHHQDNKTERKQKEKFERIKERLNFSIPKNLTELSSVQAYLSGGNFYINSFGDCAGFQMNIEGSAIIEPVGEYLDPTYKIILGGNTLLGYSLAHKTFKGIIFTVLGSIKVTNLLFADYYGNSIHSTFSTVESLEKIGAGPTNFYENETLVKNYKKEDYTIRPINNRGIILRKNPNYFRWKAQLLDDIQELEKITHNKKGTPLNINYGKLSKTKAFKKEFVQLKKVLKTKEAPKTKLKIVEDITRKITRSKGGY